MIIFNDNGDWADIKPKLIDAVVGGFLLIAFMVVAFFFLKIFGAE